MIINSEKENFTIYFLFAIIIHLLILLVIQLKETVPVREIPVDLSLFYGSGGGFESYSAVKTPDKQFEFYENEGIKMDLKDEIALTGRAGELRNNYEKTSGLDWNIGFSGNKIKGFDKFPVETASTGSENIIGPAGKRKVKRSYYPPYPVWAREKGLSGTVELKFWVNAEGLLVKIEVEKTSGDMSLDKEAALALKKWLFEERQDRTELDWGKIKFFYKLK